MQHRIKHLGGERARTLSLVFVHPRILRQSAGSRSRLGWLHQPSFKTGRTDTKDAGLMGPTQDRRLGWLHQPSFKTGRTDTKDAGLMAPTQPTPYAPPDTCKNRRLGRLHQPSFNAWQSDTTGSWVDGAHPAYDHARPGPARCRPALRKSAAVIA